MPRRHGWMAPFALVLMAGGLALVLGAARLVGIAAGAWDGAHGFSHWPGFSRWAEAARGVVLTGFPWAQPGAMA